MKKEQTDRTVPVFDRTLGALHGLPDVCSTRESTVRIVPPFGVDSTMYSVQTYRQREVGDTIFIEIHSEEENYRIVIPPKIAALIARQRDQLTDKTRSKAAKIVANDRKERGEVPGFMKPKSA